jgi:RHS repeat-associated protein
VTSGLLDQTLTPQSLGAFNASTNRLIASGYDEAGNLIQDAAGRGFTYDADNHQTDFTTQSASFKYGYDPDGHRVRKEKVGSNEVTIFVYNVVGQLIAEYNSDTDPPLGGGGTSYLTTDHIGSTRVVTGIPTGSGNVPVKARYDYLPFGEELPTDFRPGGIGYGGADTTKQKFTQKERDIESGLDYFLARYHSSAQGRFTSIDPYNIVMETQYATDDKAAKKQFLTYLSNPQRWNRYPYALNNPLFYTDPTGKDVTIYYRSVEEGKDVGHIFIYVRNDETGESAYFDYVPLDDDSLLMPVDQRRIANHASLTIETNAGQEQAILDGIKDLQNNLPDWKYLTPNCVSKSEDLLKLGGIDVGNSILPIGMWRESVRKYGNDDAKGTEPQNWPSFGNPRTYNPGVSRLGVPVGDQPGKEYGHDPRGQARKVDRSAVNNDQLIRFRGGQRVP